MSSLTCLIITNTPDDLTGLMDFNGNMTVVILRDGQDPRVVLRSRIVHCVIAYVNEQSAQFWNKIELVRRFFATMPIVGILADDAHIDLARQCGSCGVDAVLPYSDTSNLSQVIMNLNRSFVQLKELGIYKENYQGYVADALKKLEKDYLHILGTQEVADYLGIHESTLSREFKNSNLINPKRLLLYLKVNHAIRLMRNDGLTLKEITNLSGFTDGQRFNDCFKRVTGYAPSFYREREIYNVA